MARVIDTSIIIELERRGDIATILMGKINGESIVISTITASELLVGVERAAPGARRLQREKFVETLLARIPVLPFDLPAARLFAQLWALLLARGQSIAQNDLMIAAIALAYDYPIMTYNLRHFQRVPGLNVVELEV